MQLLSCRRAPDAKRGCPPATAVATGQGVQPVHPPGGGGTPSPLVGWAGEDARPSRFFGRDSLACVQIAMGLLALAAGHAQGGGGGSMPRRQGLARAPHLSERRRNLAEGMLQEPASLHLWISGYAVERLGLNVTRESRSSRCNGSHAVFLR